MFGYEILDTANNGLEAIQKYKSFKNKPDIIIMDYRMPLKNGIEATKEIMQINSHSIFIFASADSTVREAVFSMGVKFFIEKPFDIDVLIDIIQQASKVQIVG